MSQAGEYSSSAGQHTSSYIIMVASVGLGNGGQCGARLWWPVWGLLGNHDSIASLQARSPSPICPGISVELRLTFVKYLESYRIVFFWAMGSHT